MGQRKRPTAAPDVATVADLVTDPANRRRRTERSAAMLRASIDDIGVARSIVIDEDGGVLAGNGVLQAATAAGIVKVHVVEADGNTLIAVRRRGLTPGQKRSLALYDNRSSELAEWVPEQLTADLASGEALTPFFQPAELKAVLRPKGGGLGVKVTAGVVTPVVETSDVQDRFWIAVEGPLRHQARALEQLRAFMRELDGVTVDLGTVPVTPWGGV